MELTKTVSIFDFFPKLVLELVIGFVVVLVVAVLLVLALV